MALGIWGQVGMSLLGGILGGPQLNPEQRRQMEMQKRISGQLYQYGTGVPGSDPQDRASLAQQMALLGEQQANQQKQYFAQTRPEDVGTARPDQIGNIFSNQTAQRMSLSGQHALDAFSRRREALLQAAQISSNVFSQAGQGQPSGASQALGALSQQIAFSQARKKQQPGGKLGGGMGAGEDFGKAGAQGLPGYGGASSAGGSGAGGGQWGPFLQSAWNQSQQAGNPAPGNGPDGMNGMNNQMRPTMDSRPTDDPFWEAMNRAKNSIYNYKANY